VLLKHIIIIIIIKKKIILVVLYLLLLLLYFWVVLHSLSLVLLYMKSDLQRSLLSTSLSCIFAKAFLSFKNQIFLFLHR